MKAKIFILILFLTFTSSTSNAARLISGIVRDNQSKMPLPGVMVRIEGSGKGIKTDQNGYYVISLPAGKVQLVFSFIGYTTQIITPDSKSKKLNVAMQASPLKLEEVVVTAYAVQRKQTVVGSVSVVDAPQSNPSYSLQGRVAGVMVNGGNQKLRAKPMYDNDESYKEINDNRFKNPHDQPLSTFAVDVDGASYTNMRRYVNNGQLPPKDAVRIEEMINYFKYDIDGPNDGAPVALHSELSVAPWNAKHQLMRIALKAKDVKADNLPPANLVFLIDVSGSMNYDNKLPLVKSSLKMLVDQLRDKDQVAIVTYAGSVAVVLTGCSAKKKGLIKNAIDGLGAGGSTAGGDGLKMAYRIARENFKEHGNNRIIMATDGDFNVGASSDGDMEDLIVKEREAGINISVLGFGMGNIKDSKMETIADKGRGNYSYIDNITEARRAMVTEFGGTLFTVAKDVKLQIEFNPAKVAAYRLIGYENRVLENEDFNNDKKIGGDMGVGHTVTALYELIPAGVTDQFTGSIDKLKYQKKNNTVNDTNLAEVATIKFRYKDPASEKSKLQQVIQYSKVQPLEATSADFRFASAVAEFGMLLRASEFKQQASFASLIKRASAARGEDKDGYRAEFIRLAESAASLIATPELAKNDD